MKILFYTTGQDYDIFSNVTDIGFKIYINGKIYSPRSSEAVYQGVKGLTGPFTQRAEALIADQGNPGGWLQQRGKDLNPDSMIHNIYTGGYNPSAYTYYDPDEPHFSKPLPTITIKEQLMYEILLVKFTQNLDILKALLATGENTIIENTQSATYNDSFWGNGWGNDGVNALGHALMRVRQDLAEELATTGQIQVRAGFSQNLSAILGHTSSLHLDNAFISEQQLRTITPCTCTRNRVAQNVGSRLGHSRASSTSRVETPAEYVKSAILNKTGLDCTVKAVLDRDNPNKHCIELQFNNAADLGQFLAQVKIGSDPAISGTILTLDSKRAPRVLDTLGIKDYGRSNPRPTYEALRESIQRQNTADVSSQNNQRADRQSLNNVQESPASPHQQNQILRNTPNLTASSQVTLENANLADVSRGNNRGASLQSNTGQLSSVSSHNQNGLFHNSPNPVPSSQTALDCVKKAISAKINEVVQAKIVINNFKDAYILAIKFSNKPAADKFNSLCNANAPYHKKDKSILLLNKAIAEQLFNHPQRLNIPRYGKTNPRPTWQAMIFQHEQELARKIDSYDQAKIQKIDNLINDLEKEINSRWPYPNKGLKQLKVEALKSVKTCVLNGDTFDVAVTQLKNTAHYETIIQGKHSHRFYDLLQELASNAKSSLLSFRY